jgi:DNA-directed RNA polymerase specialized sigma subunit
MGKMKTWNDVKYLYYKIAGRYISQYPQFQADELVAEAWLMTYPYIGDEKYNLVARIWQVMKRYIMPTINSSYRQNYEYKQILFDCINGKDFEDSNSYFDMHELEQEEELELLHERAIHLTEQERLVLYFKFEYDLNDNEVGRIFGKSGEYARQIKVSGLNKLKGVA